MSSRIAIIQGHPDPDGRHVVHALADAYANGALAGGHETRRVDVAGLGFPWLRTNQDFEHGTAPDSIGEAQATILWAEHLVIIFPLWLGSMPAVLKAFLEQVFRPGFAFAYPEGGKGVPKRLLSGRSARIVVTMGMPALLYRWYFGAHGVKALKRSILGFCGIGPIGESLVGGVESGDGRDREKWLARMRSLGERGR